MTLGRAWLAHLMALVGLGAVLLSVLLVIASVSAGNQFPADAYFGATLVTAAAFPVAGWIIATRRSANAIGWIFLVIGLSQGLSGLTNAWVAQAGQLGVTLLVPQAAWMSGWVWAPGYVLMVTLAALLFPDGRPPSPRWRIVVAGTLLGLGVIVIPSAIWSFQYMDVILTTDSPSSLPGGDAIDKLGNVGMLLVLVGAILSIAGMLVRFRRSRGVERRQLKWFTFAGSVQLSYVAAIAFLPGLYPELTALWGILGVLAAPLVPIAATIAILRYRLYEIDRIVSRTVAWTAVTAVLAVVFIVMVVGLQALLAGFTQGQTLAVAASTLVAFALFQPVRRRVQRAVDRRFDRARYDGERTAVAFAARLRDEVDLDAARTALASTAASALQPSSAGVWLRRGAAR